MTLANKISCKGNQTPRPKGLEFLYVSQMKNNDKDFEKVIERLRKNIPDADVQKYAMRRTKSNWLFRDHNQETYTHAPDYFYYQLYPESKEFGENKHLVKKYIDSPEDSDESNKSMPNIYRPVKKAYRRQEAVDSTKAAQEAEAQILKVIDVLRRSNYKPKLSFSKFIPDKP